MFYLVHVICHGGGGHLLEPLDGGWSGKIWKIGRKTSWRIAVGNLFRQRQKLLRES